jgi:hypothetical protein
VVFLDEVVPAPIAELGGHFRGADDVGEENGGQKTLGLTPRHGASLTSVIPDINTRLARMISDRL